MSTEHRNNFKQYAMHFGLYLGIFMILKFALFPLVFVVPFLSFLFLGLTVAVPFVGYYYVKTYRNKSCGGYISFGSAYVFTLQIYFYAALLVSLAHFSYFQFIDQGFVLTHIQAQMDSILDMNRENPNFGELEELLNTTVGTYMQLSARDVTFNLLSSNIIFGFIISIPTALIVKRKNLNRGEI